MLHSRAIRIICKYELPNWRLDMIGLREALYGQFPTRKLPFMIIPIARECSISSMISTQTQCFYWQEVTKQLRSLLTFSVYLAPGIQSFSTNLFVEFSTLFSLHRRPIPAPGFISAMWKWKYHMLLSQLPSKTCEHERSSVGSVFCPNLTGPSSCSDDRQALGRCVCVCIYIFFIHVLHYAAYSEEQPI